MRRTDIVLLAAGNSRRFGTENKLLSDFHGRPMFTCAITLVLAAKEELQDLIENIIVVSKYKEIESYVMHYEQIRYVYNAHSERGISESIRLGLSKAKEENAVLFFVCDQPKLKIKTLCRLIRAFSDSPNKAGAVTDCEGNLGNPCIFAPSMREKLQNLTGDIGGKKLLKELQEREKLYVLAKKDELRDIDCREKGDGTGNGN